MNETLWAFARWLDVQPWSDGLHGSYYMFNWIETTHVLTLMLSLGMLFVIDLRMLGLCMTNVPASRIAERLDKPMLIGFTVMIITGLVLFYAVPVRYTQSIWFRIKVVLLFAAAINALLFRNKMTNAVLTWDNDRLPPRRIRVGAGLSLALWSGVIITGRCIAYDWFDCGKDNPAFIDWLVGCQYALPTD